MSYYKYYSQHASWHPASRACFQGSALAEPGGPWSLTFVLGRPENLCFSIEIICWAHWISQVQSTGLPSIFLRAQLWFAFLIEEEKRSLYLNHVKVGKSMQPKLLDLSTLFTLINPLIPKSNGHQISPCNITVL